MTGLAIPSHSRRLSRMAVFGLTLLAAGSFAVGFLRQLDSTGPSPFPTARGGAAQALAAANAIPDATPAPALQVAESDTPVHRTADRVPDVTATLPDPATGPAAATDQSAPAAADTPAAGDASATAPAPAPPSDADLPPTA